LSTSITWERTASRPETGLLISSDYKIAAITLTLWKKDRNEMDAIRRYAEGRNMQLVRTYSDEARSGLNIEGRNGLRDLIRQWRLGGR